METTPQMLAPLLAESIWKNAPWARAEVRKARWAVTTWLWIGLVAAIVGRQAGTSLMVTRFGVNSAKEIELTLRRFHQNGIELKGAIFNGVEKRRSASYGYGDYGYYSYAYKSDKA